MWSEIWVPSSAEKWVCQNDFQPKITTTKTQGENDELTAISEGQNTQEGGMYREVSHAQKMWQGLHRETCAVKEPLATFGFFADTCRGTVTIVRFCRLRSATIRIISAIELDKVNYWKNIGWHVCQRAPLLDLCTDFR